MGRVSRATEKSHLDLLRVLPGHRRGGRRRRGVLHVLPVLGDAHAAVLHALPSAAAAVGAAGDERGDHGGVARGRHCRRSRRRPAFHHPGQPQPQAAAAAVPPSAPRPPSPDPDLMGRAAVTQAEGSEEEEEGMERGHGANLATRLPSLPLTAAHTSQFSAHHARTHCWVKDCFLPSFLPFFRRLPSASSPFSLSTLSLSHPSEADCFSA